MTILSRLDAKSKRRKGPDKRRSSKRLTFNSMRNRARLYARFVVQCEAINDVRARTVVAEHLDVRLISSQPRHDLLERGTLALAREPSGVSGLKVDRIRRAKLPRSECIGQVAHHASSRPGSGLDCIFGPPCAVIEQLRLLWIVSPLLAGDHDDWCERQERELLEACKHEDSAAAERRSPS